MKKKDITILLLIIILIIQVITLFSTYSNKGIYKPVSVKKHVSDSFCIVQPMILDSIGAMSFDSIVKNSTP